MILLTTQQCPTLSQQRRFEWATLSLAKCSTDHDHRGTVLKLMGSELRQGSSLLKGLKSKGVIVYFTCLETDGLQFNHAP